MIEKVPVEIFLNFGKGPSKMSNYTFNMQLFKISIKIEKEYFQCLNAWWKNNFKFE